MTKAVGKRKRKLAPAVKVLTVPPQHTKAYHTFYSNLLMKGVDNNVA